jgi:hypothetical protein
MSEGRIRNLRYDSMDCWGRCRQRQAAQTTRCRRLPAHESFLFRDFPEAGAVFREVFFLLRLKAKNVLLPVAATAAVTFGPFEHFGGVFDRPRQKMAFWAIEELRHLVGYPMIFVRRTGKSDIFSDLRISFRCSERLHDESPVPSQR